MYAVFTRMHTIRIMCDRHVAFEKIDKFTKVNNNCINYDNMIYPQISSCIS